MFLNTLKTFFKQMKKFKIKKRSGGFREIYAPNKSEKKVFINILKNELYQKQIDFPCAHGFLPDKNIITNAEPHINKKLTISMDLSNFFDTVTIDKVGKKLSNKVKETCFIDGAARQGLPTSPMIANIIFVEADKKISEELLKIDSEIVFTRYADDLSISLNDCDKDKSKKIIDTITTIVKRSGFKINEKKTRLQYATSGRREICGVLVDEKSVHTSRRFKHKLRAVKHQEETNKGLQPVLKGLIEFSKLKKPNGSKLFNIEGSIKDATIIAKKYNISPPTIVDKFIKDCELGDNCFITNDPVYYYGMSSFTNGWTSCMALGKSRQKGLYFWLTHSGVSLAVELHPTKTITIEGVTRPAMVTRCLVYHLENGSKVFGKLYPNISGKLKDNLLKHKFLQHGINPLQNKNVSGFGAKLYASFDSEYYGYFDNCDTSLKFDGQKVYLNLL